MQLPIRHLYLYLGLALVSILLSFPLAAKEKAPAALPPLPGEMREGSGGMQIYLESGRLLLWPERGPLVLRDAKKTVLGEVALETQATKTSGAEAMGLAVEETDLGGSVSPKKKYLSGKKAPVGRSLGAGSLGEAAAAGQEEKAVVDGTPMTWIRYPNGASLWKIDWPGREEELFFDRKKSLIHNQQTRRQGPFTVVLKQFADGSYQRYFRREAGEVQVIFDADDKSYRIAFLNNKGETLKELDCGETCE